ncbi:MAG TPA: hypothetical protein VF622_14590 [Segetibacter sp.]|jgi:hypothetical protein
MKDNVTALRDGYLAKSSAISVGVYDQHLPSNLSVKKYVLITTQTSDGARTKERFKPNCTVLLDVIVRTTNATGKCECDVIAKECLEVYNPKSRTGYVSAGNDFEVLSTKIIQNESLHSLSGSENVYRRLIRFEHIVIEK